MQAHQHQQPHHAPGAAAAADAALFEAIEADLRGLSAEARRADGGGLATQITGWLQHTDYGQIKDSAERAALRLREIARGGGGGGGAAGGSLAALRGADKEVLRPFLLVCESRNPRLVGAALGSLQKLLAHDAAGDEGRAAVLAALLQAERSGDDAVRLKILQAALTLLQSPSAMDDEAGAGAVLSICFRALAHAKGGAAHTVGSTAAATVRQAVAIIFDHAVVPGGRPGNASFHGYQQPSLSAAAAQQQQAMGSSAPSGGAVQQLLSHLHPHQPRASRASDAGSLGGPGSAASTPRGSAAAIAAAAAPQHHAAALRATTGRERAALLLLLDLADMCGGAPPSWVKCSPPPGRALALDLLEFVLLHRPHAFHASPLFGEVLRDRVCPQVRAAAVGALNGEPEFAGAAECRAALRCAGALLRRHALLLPDAAPALLADLAAGAAPGRPAWQRVQALAALRGVAADAPLAYCLFKAHDASIHRDPNVVGDLARVAVDLLKNFARAASERERERGGGGPGGGGGAGGGAGGGGGSGNEDDLMVALGALHSARASGREIAPPDGPDAACGAGAVPGLPPALAVAAGGGGAGAAAVAAAAAAMGEVWVAHAALELLLALSSSVEGLADGVLRAAAERAEAGDAGASASNGGGSSGGGGGGGGGSTWTLFGRRQQQNQQQNQQQQQVQQQQEEEDDVPGTPLRAEDAVIAPETVATMVGVLWRPVLAGLSCVLARAQAEATVLLLLKGYQGYTYAAGALGEATARDAFLASLCEFAVAGAAAPPAPPAAAVAVAAPAAPVPAANAAAAAAALPGSGDGALTAAGGALTTEQQLQLQQQQQAAAAAAAAAAPPPALGVRNVHALRTLFNVAHRLADSLGPAWAYVVEVLYALDAALPPAGGRGAAAKDAPPVVFEPAEPSSPTGELLILSTAARQLFEGSGALPADAAASLLSALVSVSARALQGGPGAPAGRGQAALLLRMTDVLLSNLCRLQDLWGVFLGHVVELLHSGSPQARAAAIDALDRLLAGALGPEAAALAAASAAAAADRRAFTASGGGRPPPPTAASTTASSAAAPPPTSADLERMLLVALEAVYKEEREPDVRQGLLRAALHVLQRHGEHLTEGWVPLLRLLEAVPSWDDGATIGAAFQCVESICRCVVGG